MRTISRNTLGIFLILGGVLLLLQTLGIIQGQAQDVIWAVLFGIGGILFTLRFLGNRAIWWSIIPGLTLLSLSLIALGSIFLPGVLNNIEGLIFMGGLGLSFWIIFFSNRINWWAVIPGGILITLGVVSTLNPSDSGSGGIFFLGLGLTFLLLYMIPTPIGRIGWAIYPAVSLLLFGILLGFGDIAGVGEYIGPAAIVAAGVFLLVSSFRKR